MEASEDKTTSGPKLRGTSAEADVGEPVLPDEVLMLIFSKVTDALTLLDSLPLVCKQWCRVARYPSSWAGVELWFNTLLGEEARVLLHAPALSKLGIDEPMSFDCLTIDESTVTNKISGEPRRRLNLALRRSRAVVRDLVWVKMPGWELTAMDDDHSFACFLARQRDLRELRLNVGDNATKILEAVAALRSLEKLQMIVDDTCSYQAEFAGALPELRELRLHSQVYMCTSSRILKPDLPAGLIGDLVRGKRALRVLSVDMPLFDPDRDACVALRGLEELTIDVCQDVETNGLMPIGESTTSALQAAGGLCLQMATTALKTVTISLCRGLHMRFSDKRRERCRRVVREFARKLPHAEVQLAMDPNYSAGECSSIFKLGNCGRDCDLSDCECDSDCECINLTRSITVEQLLDSMITGSPLCNEKYYLTGTCDGMSLADVEL